MQGPLWDDERTALLIKLWSVDKLSASQCAGAIGNGLTRNAIIGKVHRLGLEKRRTVKAASAKGGNGSAGKYRGVVAAAQGQSCEGQTAEAGPCSAAPSRGVHARGRRFGRRGLERASGHYPRQHGTLGP
jgi:hypothetical protein